MVGVLNVSTWPLIVLFKVMMVFVLVLVVLVSVCWL